ncbi:MAG: saccharopine dehydrogenase NADP-binding domain-containing protein, partial [Cellulophaga fucicola]
MLRQILVLGAGKSTAYLVDYLLGKAKEEKLHITIADLQPENIAASIAGHNACTVVGLDIFNIEERQKLIEKATIVVSMLPASLHILVAKDCVGFKKH